MARRRPSRLPALLLAALPVLAAADGASAGSEPAAAGAAESPARVLRVATSGDYAPFSFPRSADPSAEPEGFDIELARRFASDRGYRLELVRFRWPDLAGELSAGSFDVAMSGVTIRPERSIAGRLSVPVAATHAVALTWKGSGAKTFAELDRPQRRVAVNAGGHLEKVAREVFRRADVTSIPDNEAVRMALLDRTFDAVVTDNYEAEAWTAGAGDIVRLGPLSDDRKACLLPADRTALAAELDRWLVAREADGTRSARRRRWFGGEAAAGVSSGKDGAPLETARPLAALASAILERQALMPFVYEAKRGAGSPIEDEAQEAIVLERAVRTVDAEAAVAGVQAPDTDGVRALFAALIAIGKDAQQQRADFDASRRPGDGTGNAASQAGGKPDAASRPAPPRHGKRYDLATDLRPAIGRIGEKIAVILVAIETPIAAAEARRVLANALAASSIRPERLEALASAIERATATRAPR